MTEDNGNKLTLSGKSTLTLKKTNLGPKPDGKKMVQVEVRKKRFMPQTQEATKPVEIDQATAQKLELIAKAKEHDAKRKQEEEEKEILRQKQKQEKEAELLKRKEEERKREEEAKKEQALKEAESKKVAVVEPVVENDNRNHASKHKDKKDDFDDEDEYYSKKGKKTSSSENQKPLTKEETFEQERKKIQKRSFETPKRNAKINVNSYMFNDDDDGCDGFDTGISDQPQAQHYLLHRSSPAGFWTDDAYQTGPSHLRAGF